MAGDEFIWEGNTSDDPSAGNQSDDWAWSNLFYNWMSSSYPASRPPGPFDARDSVTLEVDDDGSFLDKGGFSNGSISAEDEATVTIDDSASVTAITAAGSSTLRLASIQAGLNTQYDLAIGICIGEAAMAEQFGHRGINLSHHPCPAAVCPVRVCRGAFGDDLPRRDVWLSPGIVSPMTAR